MMMIDYVHRRSTSCEDIQREEALLDRHESFTNALLASSEAKVILAYGTKVQNRLLRRRRFKFLPLWGPFERTLLGLEFESNSQNSDDRYKYRRVFLFARHPSHLVWQQRGNDILRRHDLHTQAAVEMAGEDGLGHPEFFAQKLWKRDDPWRAMILKEVREINLQIELSRQPQSVSMLSVQSSAPNESRNLTWATLFDETETHSNLQLADKVLPDALKVWEGTLKPFLNWKHPSNLPMPILRWIQGSRYALFDISPVPDSKERMMVTLHRLAFPERKEKEGLPLDKSFGD
jgi:hypothetical protein